MAFLNEIHLIKKLLFTKKMILVTICLFLGNLKELKSDDSIPDILVKLNIQTLSANNKNYLAVNFKNEPHWHTYWKNPGDAGLPIKITFKKYQDSIRPTEWPTPQRYIEPGNAWAYGYEDEYSLFFEIDNSVLNKIISAEVTWLVCKHICIPGKAQVSFNLQNESISISPGKLLLTDIPVDKLKERLNQIPEVNPNFLKNLDIVLVKDEAKVDSLQLYYNLNQKTGNYLTLNENLLFPFPESTLDFKHEELFSDQDGYLYAKMNMEWNGYYLEPEIPFPKNNQLPPNYELKFIFKSPEDHRSYVIKKTFKELSSSYKQLASFYELLRPIEIERKDHPSSVSNKSSSTTQSQGFIKKKSIISFLLLAFLGGLILNLMPCVLPVISLKLFSLTSMKNKSNAQILKHNILYSLGVLSTFWVLAIIISGLKLSGTVVGWGFQLQSPIFIIFMSTVLFIFSLNMFGLFEFKTPGGKFLGSVDTKGSLGDFLNGVLATILSTPCSAPFLGTALAFAFTQGPSIIFLIFTFVGLGLAFPFLLTGFFPILIKFLPRPGHWMNTLKSFLGLSLILTSIWLLSILNTITSTEYIYWVLVSYSFFFFGIFLFKNTKLKKLSIIIFSAIGLLTLFMKYSTPIKSDVELTNNQLIKKAGLKWEKWSKDKTIEYQEKKFLTFIDFTADWCLTCKVNEKVVIQSKKFRELIEKNNISLLLGDWTDGNQEITDWLLANQMAGVPAYFFINRKGELINLGETISVKKIQDLL